MSCYCFRMDEDVVFFVDLYRVVPFPRRIAEYLAAGTYYYIYARVHTGLMLIRIYCAHVTNIVIQCVYYLAVGNFFVMVYYNT